MRNIAQVIVYTTLNVRYASLILPTGIVAYLLRSDVLAIVASILLVAAFAAEVALSIANGIEAHQSVELAKRLQADEDQAIAAYLNEIDEWKSQHGSEDPAPEGSEGEDPAPEGEGPVPAR